MNQVKEWFTIKRKLIISGLAILVGVGFTLFGPKEGTLGYTEYMLYLAGLVGFINVLFSKAIKCNMFYPVSIVTNLVGAAISIALFRVNMEEIGTSTMVTLVCGIALVLWIANGLLMKGVSFAKRAVSGFFCAVLNEISMVVVLFVIALLRWK